MRDTPVNPGYCCRWRPAVSVAAIAAVLLILGVAGLSKFADLNRFRISLETWSGMPAILRSVLVVAVPAFELSVAFAWLLGAQRGRLRIAAAVFLSIATAGYLLHATLFQIPDCGCFGLIAQAESDRQAAFFLVARNVSLLGLLGISWFADRAPRTPRNAATRPRSTPPATAGFTLIETTFVIIFTGLLVALLVPSLEKARVVSARVAVRSALGQHARVIVLYIRDWDSDYPIYANPNADLHVIRSNDRTLTYDWYFSTVSGWHVALADEYYNGRSDGDDFQRRGALPGYAIITPYFYSSSFLAQPSFWNERTRTGPEQWQGVRDTQVQWPSAKVLFLDFVMWNQTARPRDPNFSSERNTDVALLDGSASQVGESAFVAPYFQGEGNWEGSVFDWGIPGLHTRNGVAGRDIR